MMEDVNQEPIEIKPKKGKAWEKMDDLRNYVARVKKRYPLHLSHVEPDMLFYASYSQQKSKAKAKIMPIKDIWALFSPQCYILAVHKESWDVMDEAERSYAIFHELLHIPDLGFVQGEPDYKKLNDHDVQDFSLLIDKFGVYHEKIKSLVDDIDVHQPEPKQGE